MGKNKGYRYEERMWYTGMKREYGMGWKIPNHASRLGGTSKVEICGFVVFDL